MHLGGPPAVGDQVAVEHLLEHAGPAAGGVLLVPGRQERRAHHAAGRGVVGPALAHAGAAVHGVHEVAPVVELARSVVAGERRACGHPHVGVEGGRARPARPGLSRSSGSKSALDRAEQLIASGEYIRRQQLGAGPAVAVLPGQRAAVADPRSAAASRKRRSSAAAAARPAGSRCGRARSRRRSGRTARPSGRARPAAPRTRAGSRRAAQAAPRRPPSPACAGRSEAPARQPGTVRPDPPQRPLSGVSVTTRLQRAGVGGHRRAPRRAASAAVSPATSDEQPARRRAAGRGRPAPRAGPRRRSGRRGPRRPRAVVRAAPGTASAASAMSG